MTVPIRSYLAGKTEPGRRKPAGPDPFEPYVAHCRTRVADDAHLWPSLLLDELTALDYAGAARRSPSRYAVTSYVRIADRVRSRAAVTS